MAQHDWQLTCAWSQSILRELRRSGALEDPEYHRAVSDLVLSHYHFVSADEKDYYWLLEQERWQITQRFTQALRLFEGPDCTDHSAVHVLTEFLREVYLTPRLSKTRSLILDACIAVLKTGRNPHVILPLLEARVRVRFNCYPEALAEILRSLVLWNQEDRLVHGQPLRTPQVQTIGRRFRAPS